MTQNCIFCQIVAGTANATIVFQDDLATAFRDRHPAAPVHLLIIPNQHIESLNSVREEDAGLLGHLLTVARQLAEENGISTSGYRVFMNTGSDAGQSVPHLHIHLMGGQPLSRLTR